MRGIKLNGSLRKKFIFAPGGLRVYIPVRTIFGPSNKEALAVFSSSYKI